MGATADLRRRAPPLVGAGDVDVEAVAEAVAAFVVDEERLVADHRPQEDVGRDDGGERGDVHGRGDEHEQDDRRAEAGGADRVGIAEAQHDVSEEVEGGSTEQREGVNSVEGLTHVREGLVEGEGGEHDAGHHREVEVGVGVAGERVPLGALGRLGEPSFGDDGDDVEVDPPERGGEPDAEASGDDDRGRELDLRPGAQRDDRLSEGEDDDEVVPFGEVGRGELPVLDTGHRGDPPVECDHGAPDRGLHGAVRERRSHEQPDHRGHARGVAEEPAAQVRAVARREEVEHDVADADDAVGDGEREGSIAEGLRDAEGDDEQADHGPEHREPHRALLGLDEVRQPGVADPCPPDHCEDEHAAADARPGRLRRHEGGALCEAEHEHEVEEELERPDRLTIAQLHSATSRGLVLGTLQRGHGGRLPRAGRGGHAVHEGGGAGARTEGGRGELHRVPIGQARQERRTWVSSMARGSTPPGSGSRWTV